MIRKSLIFLEKWRDKKPCLPLMIRGARQVGKTWLVREHGKTYQNLVEINFEAEPQIVPIFRKNFGDPQKLIEILSLVRKEKIIPGQTLLFLDEIQDCKEALLSLRYFKEKLPHQHVISAGSLIEFSLKDLSFPVGRIEFFHLFPMNFEEYLLAKGRDDLVQAIQAVDIRSPLEDSVHDLLLDEVSLYCLIGGLPEVIKTYVETNDLQECQNKQQIHVATLQEDFYKYASKTKVEHLRILFQGVPRLIGQKFKYSNIDRELKSRELSAALRLLEQAGIVTKVYHSSANGVPLGAQIDPKKFKVFFLDIGLCQRTLGLNLSDTYLKRKDLLTHRGAMAEQFVAQELLSMTPPNQNPELFYWQRESKSSQAEVDLLIQRGTDILPIEIKSYKSGSLKSLHLFLQEKNRFIAKGLKISAENFSQMDNIQSLPFYAIMNLGKIMEFTAR